MSIESAFPNADPGMKPVGSRVLVQLRKPKKKTSGGIILSDDSRDAERDNTQVAKVISVGSLAFKKRDTLESWPEGEWCKVGEYIRVPKYAPERWDVRTGNGVDDFTTFMIVRDTDVIGVVTGDPTTTVAYV